MDDSEFEIQPSSSSHHSTIQPEEPPYDIEAPLAHKKPIEQELNGKVPLTVDTYDIFAFETRIREMVDEQMKPVFAITKQDH